MPDQSLTCAQLATGNGGYLDMMIEKAVPDRTGVILTRVFWTPAAGASRATGCDGPVFRIRTRNTSTMTAWALLPNKTVGNKWLRLDPGDDFLVDTRPPPAGNGAADQTIINNLGLTTYAAVAGVGITFTNPAG